MNRGRRGGGGDELGCGTLLAVAWIVYLVIRYWAEFLVLACVIAVVLLVIAARRSLHEDWKRRMRKRYEFTKWSHARASLYGTPLDYVYRWLEYMLDREKNRVPPLVRQEVLLLADPGGLEKSSAQGVARMLASLVSYGYIPPMWQRSEDHIEFIGEVECFLGEDGDVYCATRASGIGWDGLTDLRSPRRPKAKVLCQAEDWPRARAALLRESHYMGIVWPGHNPGQVRYAFFDPE